MVEGQVGQRLSAVLEGLRAHPLRDLPELYQVEEEEPLRIILLL
jgi:hypothetical protein